MDWWPFPALSETWSIPLGFCSNFSCLNHDALWYPCLLPWWILHHSNSRHGMAGLQSLPTDGRRNWSLISYMLDIWAALCAVTHKIDVVLPSPVATLMVDLKRLEPDHSHQDEVWRPDHQGWHVLDARGREETSSGLESGIRALGEDFKCLPLGSQQALRYVCLSLCSLNNFPTWILFEEESYTIRIWGTHAVKSLV